MCIRQQGRFQGSNWHEDHLRFGFVSMLFLYLKSLPPVRQHRSWRPDVQQGILRAEESGVKEVYVVKKESIRLY